MIYDYEEPIRYLNELTGRNFDPSNKSTQRLLSGRYREGKTLENIKKMIEYKCNQWLGTKWEEYLRPSTLFNATNFENYYQQAIHINKNKIGGFKELK